MKLTPLRYHLTLFIWGLLAACSRVVLATNPFTQYAVDFPDPNDIVAGNFGGRFAGAEATIVQWAENMTAYGPWSMATFLRVLATLTMFTGVTNKPVLAPSGDKHDYMSWAP
jgi:hypothetical protein